MVDCLVQGLKLSERIQKVLASAGIGSRREIERWIEAGRLVVSGRQAKLGDRLSPDDTVYLDGKRLKLPDAIESAPAQCLAYYKRAGEVTTRIDPEGRRRVFDGLPEPHGGRWISVGRLDISTQGLLLFTTDGELAHRLMHPSHRIVRHYSVRVLGAISDQQVDALRAGIDLADGRCRFDTLERAGGTGSNVWFHVTLHEGRNRAVRRMFEAVGASVSRLIRTGYGPIELGRMRRGQWRMLEREELAALYKSVGLKLSAPVR